MQTNPTKKQVVLQLGALMVVGPLMYYLTFGAAHFVPDFLIQMLIVLAASAGMATAIIIGFRIAGKNKELLGENTYLAPAISCVFIPVLMLNFVLILIG